MTDPASDDVTDRYSAPDVDSDKSSSVHISHSSDDNEVSQFAGYSPCNSPCAASLAGIPPGGLGLSGLVHEEAHPSI